MADIVPGAPRGVTDALHGLRQVALVAGVAAAVAAAVWLVIWSQGQNYTVLYGQLSERESGQVMDALTAAGIEFKLNPSGAVSVPESKVQEARIRLAGQGLPQSDAMGIEMIQKESALGTSSMMESARYQSVLETELARTIVKVQGVQTARVHLALPKASVFLRDAHKATASVMLQLYPGRRLEPGQVAAIVHLVASSVPELAASDVTLVDQAGSLLNSPDESAEAAAGTRQFDYTRKLEQSFQQRILELLEPIVGAGRVRATVTADLDFTVSEETHENYDPQKTAVRSEQTSSDLRKNGDGVEGIPGALSNQPPGTSGAPAGLGGAAAAAATAANGAAGANAAQSTGGTPTSSSNRSTRNFEVDRTLSYIKQPVGTLKRLNVGVVLDDWQKVSSDGQVTTAPMTDADIKRFTQLVHDSIGLKTERGDQLNVMNQTFKSDVPPAPVEAAPLWEQPWIKQLAKQIVGAGLVLLVAFLVLRPLMKSLTQPALRGGAGGVVEGGDLAGDRVSLSGQGGKAIKLAPSFEQQIAAARTLVGQDPKRAAQVVKDWVATDG